MGSKVYFNGIPGFYNDETGEAVLYREAHGHHVIYTPRKGIGGPYGYHENALFFWEIHGILDGDTPVDEVEKRCEEILRNRIEASKKQKK